MSHEGLPHVLAVTDKPPVWGVVNYGTDAKPAARIVALFYEQAEAFEYSRYRQKSAAAALARAAVGSVGGYPNQEGQR